jgi:heterodisulfide reductase subunit B
MAAVSRLKAELAEQDADMILASIESETNALELMDKVLEAVVADELLVEQGSARLKRIEARANRHRLILRAMMEEIAEKVERPLGTLSISYGPRSAVIVDQGVIPNEFFRRTVDKAELLRALKAGPVAGAELSNGNLTLKILTR